MDATSIRTVDLRRIYQLPRKQRKGIRENQPVELIALDEVSLAVNPGELFGLLGPNGAGKTTLIKILATLLAPTSGTACVDGLDVVTEAQAIRERINMVSGGESAGYGILTVEENLWLFTQIYGIPGSLARRRIAEMLDVVGLGDRAKTRVSQLSTGLRQKMNFCRGFVTDPKILFLDEPTLGLDVTAARNVRQFLGRWMSEHPERTVLLTTHYMAEAEELCDRIAIIDRGKVLACDTPDNLKLRAQRHTIFEIGVSPGPNGWEELERIPGVQNCTVLATPESTELKLALAEESVIGDVVQHLVHSRGRILTLRKTEPTLEDAFIAVVGHGVTAEGEPCHTTRR